MVWGSGISMSRKLTLERPVSSPVTISASQPWRSVPDIAKMSSKSASITATTRLSAEMGTISPFGNWTYRLLHIHGSPLARQGGDKGGLRLWRGRYLGTAARCAGGRNRKPL
ncbi:hypothetical protein WR31_25595 [Burkholderia contaminans LMG 23361]|uniref:Uncharacterized protein n=1 Tax=Burkholderia contaminans LMG 23361 TaxID=1334628 RepID=A0ABD4AQ58_9BURK|nr:hypothetical protein WR31_25595 [Burkholderia contaminans LMG 23361]